jgi:L-aminopeptidase/D-esterase-like protein
MFDVTSIQVGQVEDQKVMTGSTIVKCKIDVTGGVGVDQRVGAIGTHKTGTLRPMHLVEIVLSKALVGGSVLWLDASSGVTRWIKEQ